MSRLVSHQQRATAFLTILVASLAIALCAPSAVLAGIPEEVSGEYSSECVAGGNIIDPVGVLFRGSQASAGKAAFEVNRAAGWTDEGQGPQKLKVRVGKEDYECRNVSVQPASEPEYRIKPWLVLPTPWDPIPDPLDVIDVPEERFHVRLWFVPSSGHKGAERKTVGTPHHEDFVKWNHGTGNHCTGAKKVEIKGITFVAKGGHAVDKGGGESGLDSGFDQGRQELRRSMENTAHYVDSEKWGNDTLIEQCDEDMAGSNGNGVVVGMNWVKAGYTGRVNARLSSAMLQGHLETTEKSTEWWFEYGPSSSEGAGTYPNKTPVKSVAEAEAVDVNRPVTGLSPGSTYYVRMFVRDEEGFIEEGNEVKFETCGLEANDEDDASSGPRVDTPECGGAVDSFYRDVNGDLGHQSWTPEGDWSTETRPASIATSATPRVVPRSDGSRVIDVFYRESDGDLGHHWYTPGSGWQTETRSASMASDPNVVTQPNGTIDVFYRTTGGELGHQWWVPESGWSSEVRSTSLSSDPHAIAHKDGSIDVLYRTGSSLGRDHWSSEGGWSHEVRSGSLVAEPRPLEGTSGALDVFYRTSENNLGHDWYVPGTGWSREVMPVSVSSEPHVVKRPNGTIDVFQRTSGGKLGHEWWVSGSGWSTETRPGNVSSDPHVVARSDGSLEVFYRDGNRLGHQWYVPGTGWSLETRPGPVAWHTDPHVTVQSSGQVDVVYETPNGQLGRDAYLPAAGWSHEIRPMKKPSRPVAAYSFDAGAGTVAEDSVRAHDGTVEGAAWAKGRYGQSLSFNGSEGEKVTIPDSSDLDLSDELTLEAWVRPTEAIEWSGIVTKVRGSGISYQLVAHGEHNAPVGYLANTEKEWGVDGGTTPLPAKTWSHIAFTSDGGRIRFYVNGELKGSDSMLVAAAAGTGPLMIGGETFKGRIDEVRVYDRALDAGELAADKATPVETPARPPVAAYSFEAGEGELAEDSAGAHDGTLEGAEWFDHGKYGGALHFDGVDDLVNVPDSNDLDLTDEFTLEAWVRPDEANEWSAVITKERGSKAISYQMHAEGESSKPVGYVENSEGRYGVGAGTSPIPPHAWSHLTLTYDGAKLRIYVNGVLKGMNSSGNPGVSADPLLIGNSISWAEEDAFKGLIDEVRIYDRVLDEGEIKVDKATPIQAPARPPVAAYSFDTDEASLALDSSGNHDGTVQGAEYVKGRYGSALKFSGSEEECVRIADSPDLRLSEEFTLEAWVRPEGGDTSNPIIFKETGGNFTYALAAGLFHPSTPEGAIAYEPNVSIETESPTNLTENAWNHLGLTYDGDKLRLYLNGSLVDTETSPKAIQTEDPLAIGCSFSWDEGMTGRIDEVRIYDRALDAGEMAADKATPIQTPPRRPVAAYAFDAGEGEVAVDTAGGNDGTLEGAEWFDHGRFGSALHFDGVDDLVAVADGNDLDLTDEFTLEAWVRPDEANEWSAVITKERGKEAISYQMHAEGEHSAPVGYVGNSKGQYGVTAGSTPIPVHAWSHLTMTYDGAKLRYYIDGVLKGTSSASDPGVSGDQLLIGSNISWGEEDAFKGLIDEVRIYDRALDEAEIKTDRVTPIETPARFPVASYSFDAGEGSVAEDSAGAHDGTIEGAEWAPGKYGSGLLFEGSETCVTVPHAAELQLDEEMTLEAWVKPDNLSDQPIVFKSAWGNLGYALGVGIWNTAKPEGFIGEGVGLFKDVVSPQSIEANVWSHLVLTYDGAQMRLYVNGSLVATQAQSTPPPTGEGPLAIGCNPLFPEDFDGTIDEVRIYDRALEVGEIEADMRGNRL